MVDNYTNIGNNGVVIAKSNNKRVFAVVVGFVMATAIWFGALAISYNFFMPNGIKYNTNTKYASDCPCDGSKVDGFADGMIQ